MDRQKLEKMLQAVQGGSLSIEEASASIRMAPFEDLGFAKVDHHRQLRCGFPEVIYGEGKTADQLVAIFRRVADVGCGCLATRVDLDQARLVLECFPDAEHDPVGRTIWAGDIPSPQLGRIVVASAGTSDLPVAREAQTTARVMGTNVDLIVDVGVAGLHRILSQKELLAKADCVVVVAGMEGALPSVVGGLVDCPVIAVPTSVGYGAAFGGVAALLGMLNSCAANVTVVNIDGGFCGGYVAALIARRAHRGITT
jgi:NCAIR mutase (PurE)-related protein